MNPGIEIDSRGGSVLAWLRFAVVGVLACGLLYPLLSVLVGGTLFPRQAGGSLVERNGVVVGSSLVAQAFAGPGYFHPRPSAAGFDPRAVAGSNLATSNPALRERIAATSAEVAAREGLAATAIPVDLVTASGSGIDPHISPEAAIVQAGRVAQARGLPVDQVLALVRQHTQPPTFGLLGQARVNVLELNLALDAISG